MINQLWNLIARRKSEQAEQEPVVDPGVQAIARTFYEPGRWVREPEQSIIGIGVFRDQETDRVLFVQLLPDLPDLMPYAEPDISAEWIPDSDWVARRYLDKEWKQARKMFRTRQCDAKTQAAQREFEKVKRQYLGD